MTDKMTRDEVMAALRYAAELVPDADAAPTDGAIADVSALFDEVEAYRAVLREFQDGRRFSNPHTRQVARDIEQQAIDRSSGSGCT
jgi:hypothetical protein